MAQNFLEKDLEQIIFETDNDYLCDRGLNICGKKYRQIDLSPYGIPDIITFERPFQNYQAIITIWEFKKDTIGVNTFLQALRYAKGVKYLLEKNRPFFNKIECEFKICLVGKNIELTGSFCFLPDIFTNVSLYTYEYKYDGIDFKDHSDYVITK